MTRKKALVNFSKKTFEEQVEKIEGLTPEKKQLIEDVLRSHFFGDVSPKCSPSCFYQLTVGFGTKTMVEGRIYRIVRINGYIRLF